MALLAVLVLAVIAADSSIFGPAQFWTFVGVLLTAIGLIGSLIFRLRSNKKQTTNDNLTLYIHFVDDLQEELKRLHDLLIEERHENSRIVRDKDVQIERLEMKVLSQQEKFFEDHHGDESR